MAAGLKSPPVSGAPKGTPGNQHLAPTWVLGGGALAGLTINLGLGGDVAPGTQPAAPSGDPIDPCARIAPVPLQAPYHPCPGARPIAPINPPCPPYCPMPMMSLSSPYCPYSPHGLSAHISPPPRPHSPCAPIAPITTPVSPTVLHTPHDPGGPLWPPYVPHPGPHSSCDPHSPISSMPLVPPYNPLCPPIAPYPLSIPIGTWYTPRSLEPLWSAEPQCPP